MSRRIRRLHAPNARKAIAEAQAMLEPVETERLSYEPISGLVWARPHPSEDDPDGDSFCLGSLADSANCPIDEYQSDWDELRAETLSPRELYVDAHY